MGIHPVLLGNTLYWQPHKFMIDQGSQFQKTLAELASLHDVTVEQTGTQSHNPMGIGERYHAPLRDTYLKLRQDHPNMDPDHILAIDAKAINDILGSEDVVPYALVFEEFPPLLSYLGSSIPRSKLAERAILGTESKEAYE